MDTSPSCPKINEESAWIVSVPDVVSEASDLKKLAADIPPNASESVAVPWNLFDVTLVPSVIPFLITEYPDIADCGVNSTDETIPTIVSEVVNSRTTLSVPVLSVITLTMEPETPAPAVAAGPTNTQVDPVYT
jgi:hypothetical protein